MKTKQKTTQKDFKIIKLRAKTYKDLIKLIETKEKQMPYLENRISFDGIINMLLLKNKIKLSKLKYLEKNLKGGLKDK